MRRRDDERGRRDLSDQDRGYYRRNDEHLRFQESYNDGGSRRSDRSSDSYRGSERYDRESPGNSGRGDNDYRGRDRYSMPGESRGEGLDRGTHYDRAGWRDYDYDESRRGDGSSYRSGSRRDEWGSDRSGRYDERRTRGYDPGQGSDYNESRLGSFDYDNYRSRDRYDDVGSTDRRYDGYGRSGSRGSSRSDRSRSDYRSEGRSDMSRRSSGDRDISGDWRRFESWGRESYGDQRGQGIGWHRRDSYHDDFWDQDEGSATDRRT